MLLSLKIQNTTESSLELRNSIQASPEVRKNKSGYQLDCEAKSRSPEKTKSQVQRSGIKIGQVRKSEYPYHPPHITDCIETINM